MVGLGMVWDCLPAFLGDLGGVLEGSWKLLKGSCGALGGLLGVSWGYLVAPRANKSPKSWFVGPPWTPNLEPKSNKNQHKIDQKTNQFLMLFFDGFLIDFRWILGPNMGPTCTKNPSKNQSKNGKAKIARSGTAPRRELNSEGRAGLIVVFKIHLTSIKIN